MFRRTRRNHDDRTDRRGGMTGHSPRNRRSHVQDHDGHASVDQQCGVPYDKSKTDLASEEASVIDLGVIPVPECQIQNCDCDLNLNEHKDSESTCHHKCDASKNTQQNQPYGSLVSMPAVPCRSKMSIQCDDAVQFSPGETEECRLTALPDDALYVILSYLQPKELCSICCTCRKFQLLASKNSVWVHHARRTAVMQVPSSSRLCSLKELCRVAPNWKLGRFKESFAVKHRTRLIPWVHKHENGLWFSTGNSIRYFQAHPSGHLREEKDRCLLGMKDDATKFRQRNDIVISGCRNGSVYGWETTGEPMFCYKQVHSSDTQCVDFTDAIIISGSRDATCKILPMDAPADCEDLVLRKFDAGERVWSLRISPCERFFAAGLAGCLDDPPVIMWDTESGECIGQLSMNHRRGAGVLDLKFDSPHELFTCGYDTFVRMWDLRTQTCVAQWEEPYDSALYCIESDGENTFVVGTARHGMVRLWDKRMTDPVQAYYSNFRNSPVYSLALDYSHLYLALDMGLDVMDFTAWKADSCSVGPGTSLQHSSTTGHGRSRNKFKR